jgi:hypothetical protein
VKIFRFICLSIGIFFVLNSASIAQDRFAKYPKIEGYEIRPGILAIPRYTANNEVCEIGLEKLLYSPRVVRLDPSLSRKEIDDILDELVPVAERGASKDPLGNEITIEGLVQSTRLNFENVSILIYGGASAYSPKKETIVDEMVATVKWKNRTCLQANPSTATSAARAH